jgi:hypothetical protein
LFCSGDGRSISREDWIQVCGEVAKLKAELDQVDFYVSERAVPTINTSSSLVPVVDV